VSFLWTLERRALRESTRTSRALYSWNVGSGIAWTSTVVRRFCAQDSGKRRQPKSSPQGTSTGKVNQECSMKVGCVLFPARLLIRPLLHGRALYFPNSARLNVSRLLPDCCVLFGHSAEISGQQARRRLGGFGRGSRRTVLAEQVRINPLLRSLNYRRGSEEFVAAHSRTKVAPPPCRT